MTDIIRTREELEQKFMASAITYFNEGARLFQLLYAIIMIQILLGIIFLAASCVLPLLGVGVWSALINFIVELLRITPRPLESK